MVAFWALCEDYGFLGLEITRFRLYGDNFIDQERYIGKKPKECVTIIKNMPATPWPRENEVLHGQGPKKTAISPKEWSKGTTSPDCVPAETRNNITHDA